MGILASGGYALGAPNSPHRAMRFPVSIPVVEHYVNERMPFVVNGAETFHRLEQWMALSGPEWEFVWKNVENNC